MVSVALQIPVSFRGYRQFPEVGIYQFRSLLFHPRIHFLSIGILPFELVPLSLLKSSPMNILEDWKRVEHKSRNEWLEIYVSRREKWQNEQEKQD